MQKIYGRLDDGIAQILEKQAAEKGMTFYAYVGEILTAKAAQEEHKKTALDTRLEVIEKSSRVLEYNTELCSFLIAQLMKQHFGQDITTGLVDRAQTLVRRKYPDIFPAKGGGEK